MPTKKKTGLIKKAAIIVKAVMAEKPTAAWYEQRRDICATCPWSTDNVAHEKLPLSYKEQLKLNGGPICTACHCFTDLKAKLPEAVCGLTEINEVPKWGAIKVKVTVAKGLTIEQKEGAEDYVFYEDAEGKQVFRTKTTAIVIDKTLILKGIDIQRIEPSCSCLVADLKRVAENHFEIEYRLSTEGFSLMHITKRWLTVHYYQNKTLKAFNIHIHTEKF